MQHAPKHGERPGGSHEGVGRKKQIQCNSRTWSHKLWTSEWQTIHWKRMSIWWTSLWFSKEPFKRNPRWRRMVFLGKIDPQDSYLLSNGTHLILARSVRRINTCWKGHLAFYSSCLISIGAALVEEWCQQRAVVHPLLLASILQLEMWNPPNSLMRTLRQAESSWRATWRLWNSQHGHPRQAEPYAGDGATASGWLEDASVIQHPQSNWHFRWSSGGGDDQSQEMANPALELPGPSTPPSFFEVPMTPLVIAPSSSAAAGSTDVPVTPRAHPTTRAHGEEETANEQIHKKAKVEDTKKPRLMQLSEQHSAMIRAVQFDDGSEFHTMDDYSQDLKMTDQIMRKMKITGKMIHHSFQVFLCSCGQMLISMWSLRNLHSDWTIWPLTQNSLDPPAWVLSNVKLTIMALQRRAINWTQSLSEIGASNSLVMQLMGSQHPNGFDAAGW